MRFSIIFIIAIVLVYGCERNLDLAFPEGEKPLVVEGYIENGQPPIVFLSKGIGFFSKISTDQFQNLFIDSANVTVSDGTTKVKLVAYKRDGFIVYSIPIPVFGPPAMIGQVGKIYTLDIQYAGRSYTANTQILNPVPLDSIYTKPADINGKVSDSLFRLFCVLSEPQPSGDKYRALTKRNNDVFYDTDFNSVYFDDVVNGTNGFTFPLNRGKSAFQNSDTADFKQYGYFKKGDTVYVKYCHIDNEQYLFWRSFEQQNNSLGNPFAPTVVIKSNIKGDNCTGIWASYGAYIDSLIVK